jgi:hypothetical protein
METTFIIIASIVISLATLFFVILEIFRNKRKMFNNIELRNKLIFNNTNFSIPESVKRLSPISTNLFNNDKDRLEDVIYETKKLIDFANDNPNLLFELEDFFIYNMTYGDKGSKKIQDFLIIYFNKLTTYNTPRYNYFIGKLFDDIIQLDYTDFNDFLIQIKTNGTKELKIAVIEYFISQQVFNKKINYFKTILKIFDFKEDDFLCRYLADYLVNQFHIDQNKTLELFEAIFPKVNIINNKYEENKNFLIFINKFSIKLFIDSNGIIDNIIPFFIFLSKKYSIVINVLKDDFKNPLTTYFKQKIYKTIEQSGINQWDQAIGNIETNRAINNNFFVEAEGDNVSLIQRDILFDYYKYLIQINNDDYSDIVFRPNYQYYKDTLTCINFKEYSVIGYVATLSLTAYILNDKKNYVEKLNSVICILKDQKSNSSKFFLFILCDCLLKTKGMGDENYKELISVIKEIIIPLKFHGNLYINIFGFMDNAGLDIIENSNYYSKILDDILTKDLITTKYNEIKKDAINTCFLSSLHIGEFIAKYIIDSRLYHSENGSRLLIDLLGAIYYRNKEFVLDFIKVCNNMNISISEWKVINNIDISYENIRDARSYQTNWNQLIIQGFINDKKLRYYLIKDLIGGLTQSNSVEEFSKEFRRFIIEVTKGYIFEPSDKNLFLKNDIALKSTESKRIINGGIIHKPN